MALIKWFIQAVSTEKSNSSNDTSTKLDKDCNNHGRMIEGTGSYGFQMPLHYPRYTKGDYEKMEEWKVDMLLKEYGLYSASTWDGASLDRKRAFAMGSFLWPDQL